MGVNVKLVSMQRRFIEHALGELVPEFGLCASEAVDLLAAENGALPGPSEAEPGFDTSMFDPDFWNWALQLYSLLFSIAAYYVGRMEAGRDQKKLRDDIQTITEWQKALADETRNGMAEIAELVVKLKKTIEARGVDVNTEDLNAVFTRAREATNQAATDTKLKPTDDSSPGSPD